MNQTFIRSILSKFVYLVTSHKTVNDNDHDESRVIFVVRKQTLWGTLLKFCVI